MEDRLSEIQYRAEHKSSIDNPRIKLVELKLEDYQWMVAEIKRLKEASNSSKSEALMLQRELWRKGD